MSTTEPGEAEPSSDIKVFLVPLDGSQRSAEAVPIAAGLATRLGAGVELLSAVGNAAEAVDREHALARINLIGSGVVRTVVVEPDPVAAITRAAEQSGLQLCLATQGRGRSAAVMGSVALGALQGLAQPVLCVGTRVISAVDRGSLGIVVCLDGSAQSEAALAVGAQWAEWLGDPLTLLTAVADAPQAAGGGPPKRSFGMDDPQGYLDGHVARLNPSLPSINTRIVTDPLHPGGAIQSLLADETASMVVAGTRGRSGLARAVLGSTAALIVQYSSAPVLLVPESS